MLLRPGQENKEYWFMFSGVDKFLHVSIFAALGLFFMLSFRKTTFIVFIQIMLIYAFLTEILQEEMKFGRSMENLDILADTIGVLIGYFLSKKIASFLNKSI